MKVKASSYLPSQLFDGSSRKHQCNKWSHRATPSDDAKPLQYLTSSFIALPAASPDRYSAATRFGNTKRLLSLSTGKLNALKCSLVKSFGSLVAQLRLYG